MHGGSVAVASEVDSGTTFTVSIPIGAAHLPADRSAPLGRRHRPRPGRCRTCRKPCGGSRPTARALRRDSPRWLTAGVAAARVLVADDNADMREYMTRLLGDRWSVDAVADGATALAAAQANRPTSSWRT